MKNLIKSILFAAAMLFSVTVWANTPIEKEPQKSESKILIVYGKFWGAEAQNGGWHIIACQNVNDVCFAYDGHTVYLFGVNQYIDASEYHGSYTQGDITYHTFSE